MSMCLSRAFTTPLLNVAPPYDLLESLTSSVKDMPPLLNVAPPYDLLESLTSSVKDMPPLLNVAPPV